MLKVLWILSLTLSVQIVDPSEIAPPTNLHIVQEYFVSPTGCETNYGTETSPWPSVNFALSKVGGGKRITLLPGVYTDRIFIESSGPTGNPTIIQSQRKWEAIIRGSPSHGVYTADGVTNVIIDGLQVSFSGIDGIKVGSHVTVRNCWIHHSAEQGVAAHRTRGTTVEYNLIEFNGTSSTLDHGIYISGTNDVIRGNVIRWNKTYGCQIYYDPPASSAECQFYNNLVYGNKDALTVWSPSGQTNYVFNNTLSSDNYVLIADYGNLCVSNNILMGPRRGRIISREGGAKILTDYNLTSYPTTPRGVHDIVTANPGWVDSKAGLFWLDHRSVARGKAAKAVLPPVDFFGRVQSRASDIGAFQYSSSFADDPRVLDPSRGKPDYWLRNLAMNP